MTNADSRHYEFFMTQAVAGEPIKPPDGEWTLLHVAPDVMAGGSGALAKKSGALIVWSRPKKH